MRVDKEFAIAFGIVPGLSHCAHPALLGICQKKMKNAPKVSSLIWITAEMVWTFFDPLHVDLVNGGNNVGTGFFEAVNGQNARFEKNVVIYPINGAIPQTQSATRAIFCDGPYPVIDRREIFLIL